MISFHLEKFKKKNVSVFSNRALGFMNDSVCKSSHQNVMMYLLVASFATSL